MEKTALTMLPDGGHPLFDAAKEVEADTIEEVDVVFKAQRKLTFAYAALFFGVTLLIPLLSITAPWWYEKPIWGGLTLNFLVVSLLFHLVYWLIGLCYTIQANHLEDKFLGEKDGRRAKQC